MYSKMKFILLFSLLFVLSSCGIREKTQDSWGRISQNKKIIIGLDDTFVPMGFREKNGTIAGFDVDLAKAVFALYDIQVDFQAIDWNMKETELNNQTIDLIWNGYSVNPSRKEKVLFSLPYMKNEQVLVSLENKGITSFSKMRGKTLGLQNGSSGESVFNSEPQVLKDFVKGEPILYSGFNEALMDVKAGRIDALLIDQVYANYYLQKMGELDKFNVVSGDFQTEDFAVGLRKQDKKLMQKINEGLKELVRNHTFEKISKQWFGENVAPKELDE